MGILRTSPLVHLFKKALSLLTTQRFWCLEIKCKLLLRFNAPGKSPASVRIWKPLQMPSTFPPSFAKVVTAYMTGEKRAMEPERK